MAHVAVVGKPSRHRFQVTNQLQMQVGMQVSIYTSMEELLPNLERKVVHLVVMVEERMTDDLLMSIDEFSRDQDKIGLVFVSKELSSEFRAQFGSMKLKNCTLLDFSREAEDLKPVIRKMLLNKPVHVRKHFRHRTNQVGFLNSATNIQNSRLRVHDISKGGLMATYQTLNVRVGETVHIFLATEDGTKQHRIIGKVAWHKEKQRQFGISFDSVSVEIASMRFTANG